MVALVLGYRALGQIRSSNGRQGGRGLALAGIIWAWTALGIVVVTLIVVWIVAATRITYEDVNQRAANLAFAELSYKQAHGRFTKDFSALGPIAGDTRISMDVVVDWSGSQFCVDAHSGPYSVRTWEDQFNSGNQRVWTWRGLCNRTLTQPTYVQEH